MNRKLNQLKLLSSADYFANLQKMIFKSFHETGKLIIAIIKGNDETITTSNLNHYLKTKIFPGEVFLITLLG
ncbi:hypothetical protein RCG24_10115 [Neobacillus sp. OS1-32]|uniref:hypothetical protein n=1 Tax=Neobacillus sp. OS1-32 TaxID=3070682 RepID=UPI0027DF2B03|nr:hypothetical protein [Neobacillus sp. OS1-32]WML32156.1 hypothetical protein RCG24_10115 [Neobacillus sp. OS1-32]